MICQIVNKFIPHSYYIPTIDELKRDLLLLGATTNQIQSISNTWKIEDNNIYKKVNILKDLLTSRATGGAGNEENYVSIRSALIKNNSYKSLIPEFIYDSPTLQDFWQFIKYHLGSYAERRVFIKNSFNDLLNETLNANSALPHNEHINEITQIVNEEYISEAWNKALERMKDDPEAAITSARSLIEVVCKHILDTLNKTYEDGADLPKLYKQTAAALNLAPDQHTEAIFKQILSGCQSVVDGLGALRNKLGDAHGKSKNKVRPMARHAALAVNLSGSMCSFLLESLINMLTINKSIVSAAVISTSPLSA